MQITIENTPEVMHANGLPVRVWLGKTGRGTPVLALITRIAAPDGDDAGELERELSEAPTRLVDPSGESIASPRSCTVCNGRNRTGRPAAFVASGPSEIVDLPGGGVMSERIQWFECGEHDATDNLADVTRETLEPLAEWFARHDLPLPGGVGNGVPGAPMGLPEPWASMLDVRLTSRVAELEAELAVLQRRVADAERPEAERTERAAGFPALADVMRSGTGVEPSWLIKDFWSLYSAAQAVTVERLEGHAGDAFGFLVAQLNRLRPAFEVCDSERRGTPDRRTRAEGLALDGLHRWLHSPGGDGDLIEAASAYHDQAEAAELGACERLDCEAAADDSEHRSKLSVHGALTRIRSALSLSDGLEPQLGDPFHASVRRVRRVLDAHDDRSEPETSPGGTPAMQPLPVAITDLVMHHPIAAGDDAELAAQFIRWAMRGAIVGHHAREAHPEQLTMTGRLGASRLDEPDREAWLTGFRLAAPEAGDLEALDAGHCWKCGMTLGRVMMSDGERRICVRCNDEAGLGGRS